MCNKKCTRVHEIFIKVKCKFLQIFRVKWYIFVVFFFPLRIRLIYKCINKDLYRFINRAWQFCWVFVSRPLHCDIYTLGFVEKWYTFTIRSTSTAHKPTALWGNSASNYSIVGPLWSAAEQRFKHSAVILDVWHVCDQRRETWGGGRGGEERRGITAAWETAGEWDTHHSYTSLYTHI